jgi:hypothetical protein
MGDRIWDRRPKIEAFERQSPEGPVFVVVATETRSQTIKGIPSKKPSKESNVFVCLYHNY